MTLFISLLLGLLALVLLVPALVLAVECLMASVRPQAACRREGLEGRYVTKVVVIPAHDEELSIGRTLAALLPELEGQDRVLVVADNCTDATATVAAGLGVAVLERKDPDRRGKGFALDFALNHLRPDPPEVVVFLDADCELTPGSLEELAQVAQASGRPAQAYYQMRQEESSGRPRIAEFAWRLRGLARPMGLAALGMPCQLYGTGMALPWPVLERLSLASGNIVEDMKLTLDLIEDGAMPLFCADACVLSAFPATEAAASAQRKRWEHGHIATLLSYGLPALWRALARGDPRRIALALDVCVPPLSLFLLLLVLATLLTLPAVALLDAGHGALALLGLSWCLVLFGLSLAWFEFGRDIIPFRSLFKMPFYVVSKLSLYLKFFTQRQKEWNRADRSLSPTLPQRGRGQSSFADFGKGAKRLRVLAVSSGGGHWIELMRIMPAFAGCEIAYLTVRADYRDEAAGAPFYTANDATRWNPLGALLQAIRIFWLLLRLRPDLVVTTGAAPGYFAVRIGKRLGARTLWLDSLANVDRLSRAGSMAGKYADLWLTQWPELASEEGPEYAGQVV